MVPSSHTQNSPETLVVEVICATLIASEYRPAFSSIQKQRYYPSRVHLSFGLKRQVSMLKYNEEKPGTRHNNPLAWLLSPENRSSMWVQSEFSKRIATVLLKCSFGFSLGVLLRCFVSWSFCGPTLVRWYSQPAGLVDHTKN